MSNYVLSQSCLPQGIEFNTQAEIDSFQILYPGCSHIEGDVKIKGSGINNLNGLNNTDSIDGYLKIENNLSLSSITGLLSLKYVGGDLYISGNYSLKNLTGLDSLHYIGGDVIFYYNGLNSLEGMEGISNIFGSLWIIGNDSVTDLNGLNSISTITGELVIQDNSSLCNLMGLESLLGIGIELLVADNPSLTSLSGLETLTCINDGLAIWGNYSPVNLSGLNNVTTIGSYICIAFNPSLKELDGLDSLINIGQYLLIFNNDSLQSLSGLNSLSSIGGWIDITNNPLLKSLSGLDYIDPNTITGLYIKNNASLSTCHVQSICDYLAAPNGAVSISGNDNGCKTRAEVEAACAGGKETDIKVFLQGSYAGSNTMNANLSSVLPYHQPYDTLPWMYTGTETINTIPSNVTDWVLVEIRDSSDYNILIDTRAGVLLTDGSIKDTNLTSGLYFYNIDSGYYYVAVRHRNHISVMTEQPINIPSQIQIDFTDTNSTKLFGGYLQAQIELEHGIWGMISGDINNDGMLKYSGPDNDRMEIIQQITNVSGSTNITKVISGYYIEDLDLNSQVKYSGPNNDGAIIIQNIISLTGSTSITAVYSCPLIFLYP